MSVATPPFERTRTLDSLVERLARRVGKPVADGFELVTDLDAFEELEEDWNDLLGRMNGAGNPFLSFNWHWHWCEHYLAGGEGDKPAAIKILVHRENGRATSIWPFVLYREMGLRVLRFMGEPVSQYSDILAEPSADLSQLRAGWDHLCEMAEPDALVMRKVRSDSAIAPLMHDLDAIPTEEQEAPFADLTTVPDYETYQARFSKRFRRNCRRQCNRLEELGALEFRMIRESEEARRYIADAFTMKREWLRETGRIAPSFNDERFGSFFNALAGSTDRPAGCVVSALTLDGHPIAVEVGILDRGQYAVHIGAFEAGHARLSPGTHQMARSIAQLIEMGIERYDLLAPHDSYKMTWTDKTVGVGDYVVPRSVTGRVYADLYLKRLRPAMKNGLTAISNAASKVTSSL